MTESCAPRHGGVLAMARPMRAWSGHGPGRAAVLIWGPVLLVDPVLDSFSRSPVWPGPVVCLAVLTLFTVAVITAYRRGATTRRTVTLLLTAQIAVTFAAAAWYGDHWYALFVLAALAVGALTGPRLAPAAILTLTLAGGAVVAWRSGDWTQVWTTSLTTFLAGFGTYVFHRLLSVIAELDATRQELAGAAVDRERLRFSRDLHDLLGHTLSVIVVKAEVIRRILPTDGAAAAQHAADIESLGRRSLVEVREAVAGYREADLARELDRSRVALDAAGISLEVERGVGPLPIDVDSLCGWVVREATTNVIRHSGAARCRIGLVESGGELRLVVADDGGGGEPGSDGRGLRGLSERVASLGGTLTVAGDGGFTLTVRIPLPVVQEAS